MLEWLGEQVKRIASPSFIILGSVFLALALIVSLGTGSPQTAVTVTHSTPGGQESSIKLMRSILLPNQEQFDQNWVRVVSRALDQARNIVCAAVALPYLLILLIEAIVEKVREYTLAALILGLGLIIACVIGGSLEEGRQRAARILTGPTPTPVVTHTPTPLPTLPPSAVRSGQEQYYVALDVKAPQYLKHGQSQAVQLALTIWDRPLPETLPIPLLPSSQYTTTAEIQAINFELAPESSQHVLERLALPNRPVEWNWVLTPKETAKGPQAILWSVWIDDKQVVSKSKLPVFSVDVDVVNSMSIFEQTLFQPITIIIGMLFIILSPWQRWKEIKRERELEYREWQSQLRKAVGGLDIQNAKIDGLTEYFAKMYLGLDTHFSSSDIRDLCFLLSVDYENLPGNTKRDKARELILHMVRRGRDYELWKACRELRPNGPW
jgi:hypothetical protein